VAGWTFLTIHARVLLLMAHDPGARLRDIAASLDITERSAFGIITDLAEAKLGALAVGGGGGFSGAQRRVLLAGMTAAEFGVGGDG
jgi:hypothetical protein